MLQRVYDVITADFNGYVPQGYTSMENLSEMILQKAKDSLLNNQSFTDAEKTRVVITKELNAQQEPTAEATGYIKVILTITDCTGGLEPTTKVIELTLNMLPTTNTQEVNP